MQGNGQLDGPLDTESGNRYSISIGGDSVPEISLFAGIRISMYYDDHNPPHFHASYNGQTALVDIQKGYVIRGALPNRQLKYVLAWTEFHQDELMQDWELARSGKALRDIAPLF